jgi:hypothetical protein
MCIICGCIHPVEYRLIELRYAKSPHANSGAPTVIFQTKRDLNRGFFSSVINRVFGKAIVFHFIEAEHVNALRTAIDQSDSLSVGALLIGPCKLPTFGANGVLIYWEPNQLKMLQASCLFETGTINPPPRESPESTNTDVSEPVTAEQIKVISPQTVPIARTPARSSPTEQDVAVEPDLLSLAPPPHEPPELADDQLNLDNQDKGLTPEGDDGHPFAR